MAELNSTPPLVAGHSGDVIQSGPPLPGPNMTTPPLAAAQAGSAAAPVPASVPASTPTGDDRTLYRSGSGRATIFSFVFLLLLPFFASLPVMISMRIASGHYDSTLGLAVLALGFAAIMLLVLAELLFSIRARIALGETAVKLTLPSGRGLVPMLRYHSHEIPYSEIVAVETRREIYGGALAPVMLRGARIVTKKDGNVQLGYLNEANVDPAFPYAEIASKIAKRASIEVNDRGAVHRKVTNKFMGLQGLGEGASGIDEATIADLNRRHAHVVYALIACLVLLVGAGIVTDLLADKDPVAYQSAPASPPKKK